MKRRLESLVLTLGFYLATIFSLVRFYDFTFNMAMVMSYTLGLGLILISIPMLHKNAEQFKTGRFVFLALTALLTSGLLEIHGVVFGLILLGLLLYHWLQQQRIHRWLLVLIAVSLAGNLFTYLSPGNMARRVRNEVNSGFDVDVFLQIAGTVFDKLFQVGSIVFFGFVVLIALVYNQTQSKIQLKRPQWMLLLFGGCIALVPLFLIVHAVGEQATNFNRVLNLSTVYLLLFFFGVLWLVIRQTGGKIALVTRLYFPGLLAGWAAMIGLYFLVDSQPAKNVYRQIATGEMLNYERQEQARRDYLLAQTEAGPKQIPSLDHRNYKENVMGLRNESKFNPGFRMHHTYNDIFNGGRSVEVRQGFPDPRVFASIYFYNNDPENEFEMLHDADSLTVIYVPRYNCLLLKKNTHRYPKQVHFVHKRSDIRMQIQPHFEPFEAFYGNEPNLMGMVLAQQVIDDIDAIKQTISIVW